MMDDSSDEPVMPLKEIDISTVNYEFMKSGNSKHGVLITHGTYIRCTAKICPEMVKLFGKGRV